MICRESFVLHFSLPHASTKLTPKGCGNAGKNTRTELWKHKNKWLNEILFNFFFATNISDGNGFYAGYVFILEMDHVHKYFTGSCIKELASEIHQESQTYQFNWSSWPPPIFLSLSAHWSFWSQEAAMFICFCLAWLNFQTASSGFRKSCHRTFVDGDK